MNEIDIWQSFIDLCKQLDKQLDKIDKYIPNILGNSRKIKNIYGLFFTGLYCIVIYQSLLWYGTIYKNIFGVYDYTPKPLWEVSLIVICCTVLSYMIYHDIRYYMKYLLYLKN